MYFYDGASTPRCAFNFRSQLNNTIADRGSIVSAEITIIICNDSQYRSNILSSARVVFQRNHVLSLYAFLHSIILIVINQ